MEDFPGCPVTGDNRTFSGLFRDISGCGSASSGVIQNAYKCYGGFIAAQGSNKIYLMLDPDGQFLFFTMFQDNNNYRFGFGVKG